MLMQLTLLVAALLVLGYLSTRLVRVINSVSIFFRVPKFFLSFIVLGLGTSLPDLVVAGVSSSRGQLSLVLGAIIGANVALLCLIVGFVVFVKGGLRVREKTVLENFGWLFFVLAIPFFLLLDNKLTFVEGIILIVVYLMYVYNVSEQEVFHKKEASVQTELKLGDEPPELKFYKHLFGREVIKLVAFLGLVVLVANVVVDQALLLSGALGVPPMLIGLTVVALGVTLPELVLNLAALKAREEEVIWGDLIGSFTTELTLVLGVAAIFSSGADSLFNFAQALTGYGFMAMCFLLIFLFAYSSKRLSKTQGIALMLLYVIFLSLQVDLLAVA